MHRNVQVIHAGLALICSVMFRPRLSCRFCTAECLTTLSCGSFAIPGSGFRESTPFSLDPFYSPITRSPLHSFAHSSSSQVPSFRFLRLTNPTIIKYSQSLSCRLLTTEALSFHVLYIRQSILYDVGGASYLKIGLRVAGIRGSTAQLYLNDIVSYKV